jgi:hypothetical protein
VFQFYAVLPGRELRHLHVKRDIQQELTEKFETEASKAVKDKHEIPFSAQYPTALKHEILLVQDFHLPDRFVEDVEDSNHCDDIKMKDIDGRHVKAIVGATPNEDGEGVQKAIFKELSGARIMDRSPWHFYLEGSYLTRLDKPGLAIPDNVHAVYQDGDLRFFSYDTAKKFLDLTGIYMEAAKEDMETFLSEGPVTFDSKEETLDKVADSWCRRRISMVLASEVWTRVTVSEIKREAGSFGVEIHTRDKEGTETIILPETRAGLKDVLRVLNQDFFYSLLDREQMVAGIKTPHQPE